jgi:ankyrin repeat protein
LLVDLLIARRTNPDADPSTALKWASEHGFAETVKQLLEDQIKEQNSCLTPLEFAVNWVCLNNHPALLKLLLADQRVDPSFRKQEPLRLASMSGFAEIVKLLLTHKNVDPSVSSQTPLRFASERGHADVVRVLLADQRVDPTSSEHYSFLRACVHGHAKVVKLLLADKRVDPSVDNNSTIIHACSNGFIDVVKLLLADKRVDPSARDNTALWMACLAGCVEVVKLLLADERVDPRSDTHDGLISACRAGHTEVVKLLLTDPRVDPSVSNQYPLVTAKNDHPDVVKILLADQRVCIPISPLFTWPFSLSFALFVLRRSFRVAFRAASDTTDTHQAIFRSVAANVEALDSERKFLLDAHLLSDLSSLCLDYVPDLFCHLNKSISSLTDPDSDDIHRYMIPLFTFDSLSTL